MFCYHCGAQVPEGAAFCPQCGKPLTERAKKPEKQEKFQKPRSASPKWKKRLALLAGAAAVLALACVFLYHREAASLPDPGHYFQNVALESGRTEYEVRLSSSEDFSYAVKTYAQLLTEEYPLHLVNSGVDADGRDFYRWEYAGSRLLTLGWNDFPGSFEMKYGKSGDRYVLRVENWEYRHVSWKNTETFGPESDLLRRTELDDIAAAADLDGILDNPAAGDVSEGPAEPAPESAPELLEKPDSGSALLPDPGLFLSCGRGEDQAYTSYGSDGWLVGYSFDLERGPAAEAEFRTLLENERYQLELSYTQTQDNISSSAALWNIYYYSYMGTNPSVGEIEDWRENRGDVILSVGYYYGENRIGMTLYYSSAFMLEDSGARASDPPADYSGNPVSGGGSSGGSGVSIPEFARKDCSICDGSGKCQTCGGDGYLWSSAADKENRNCYSCRNHDGKCTYCGGTGKQKI